MDVIFIDDLKLMGRVGAYDWERLGPQAVEFALEVAVPDTREHLSPRLEDTVNYAEVAECVKEVLATGHFMLLEVLAERIADSLLERFSSPWVKVSVAKPGILRGARRVGVTVQRSRASTTLTD